MNEIENERTALEGRVQQYGSMYDGMRKAFAGEQMPDSVKKYAPQYALALTAARDLDRLSKSEPSYKHQASVLQLLIAAALAETPLKDGLTPGNPVGDLYQRLTKRDAPQ